MLVESKLDWRLALRCLMGSWLISNQPRVRTYSTVSRIFGCRTGTLRRILRSKMDEIGYPRTEDLDIRDYKGKPPKRNPKLRDYFTLEMKQLV